VHSCCFDYVRKSSHYSSEKKVIYIEQIRFSVLHVQEMKRLTPPLDKYIFFISLFCLLCKKCSYIYLDKEDTFEKLYNIGDVLAHRLGKDTPTSL